MTIRKIVVYPDSVLELECEKVEHFDKKLGKLIDDMFDTMYEAEGVGLAAPQIGIAKQVAVVDVGDERGPIELVNPVITEKKGTENGAEGCLSFPGLFGDVERAFEVTVEAFNRKGKPFTVKANGFLARALQHEIDHLHGILFTSKVTAYYEEGAFER